MSVNKAIVVGRLGVDPEVKQSQSGTSYARLSIATNRAYDDKNGERQENTEWHKVVVFGKQAESCEKYLRKGRQVYVEGRLETSKWTDDDGNDRYTTRIIGRNVTFLSGGANGSSNGAGRDANGSDNYSEKDIPF